MTTASKNDPSATKASGPLLNLESLICDLDRTVDVLFDICHEKLARRRTVVFSEEEASRIYFMLCNTARGVATRKLPMTARRRHHDNHRARTSCRTYRLDR